ncbi:O-fucosyltransferase family protein [Rhodotorula paludigena]|uniref:O-fucosyltransferase family protein n=1 Tax=Rhodotorula paludigena TaxID=86838 RepID=UPI003180FE61
MVPYKPVAASAGDAELGYSDAKEVPSSRSSAASRHSKERTRRWALAGAAAFGFLFLVWLVGVHRSEDKREAFGPPPPLPQRGPKTGGVVPDGSTLLTRAAPARSYWDALRPDLRYLTLDSWSGMSGQYFTALSLLYLAHLTQRVAIIPSFRDWDHYGDSMITLDLLFDMEKFRQERGALFVYWDEVKPLDRQHKRTQRDAIGCYMGNNAFEGGRSFDEHNLDQTIWRVARPGGGNLQHSVESFVLFDVDEKDRLARLHKFADAEKREIPENMLGSQLLCYSNLWDLSHAHALADGWQWHEGFRGQQRGDGELKDMLGISARGTHPEWWAIGQYIDFAPGIWDIALTAAMRTMRLNYVPKNLITIHLRRGDFKSWCSAGENCTPQMDRYVEQLDPLLALSPPGTKVLVTTDEQDDRDFLRQIDALGWYRVDHRALGTQRTLEKKYGDAWRWADAAVDQAILSLGQHFVGTSGSQVSLLTELRVAAWNGGETRLVERPS